jgi:putative transposase
VHDRCANGESLKCLVVVDEYTRMCLAIEMGGVYRARQALAARGRGELYWEISRWMFECGMVLSRREAQVIIEQHWRQYNEERLHSSLGFRPPGEVGAGKASLPAAGGRGGIEGLRKYEGLTFPLVR